MFDGPFIATLALAYLSTLFAIAWFGDRFNRDQSSGKGAPTPSWYQRHFGGQANAWSGAVLYSLSLAVYCTAWSFFGNVGLSARTGYDFVPIYLGPILMFTIGLPLVLYVVRLAKNHNITSVADFVSARYGKSQSVAAVVTIFMVIALLPYIALQLKAIAIAIEILIGNDSQATTKLPPISFDGTSFMITLALAVFAMLFGTRHADAREHQHGLMLAIATGSVVKLVAFATVGLFAIYSVFSGLDHFIDRASQNYRIMEVFGQGFVGDHWVTVTLLSFVGILLLPRQFHVGVVENASEAQVRSARWMFPLYLIAIMMFVVAIAVAGVMTVPTNGTPADYYVLGLPIAGGSHAMTLLAFLGGLSATTSMVIVETIALAIMVCNGLFVPMLLRQNIVAFLPLGGMTTRLLVIRRVAIVVILLCSYFVYRAIGTNDNLTAIGLISLAGVAQVAPVFFGGLIWRDGTAHGAIAGLVVGFLVWGYTMLLPWVADAGWISSTVVSDGPFGLTFLRPEQLFYLDFSPLTHSVVLSIGANILAFVTVSTAFPAKPFEQMQADAFLANSLPDAVEAATPLDPLRMSVQVRDLQSAVERYLGAERAEQAFADYAKRRQLAFDPDAEADVGLFRFTENLLASAIGPSSSRLVLALLLKRDNVSPHSARKLLDDASEALQYNRDLLQLAIDQVRHGLCVFDKDMSLVCWNRQFRILLDLPTDFVRVGLPLDRLLREFAKRGDFGSGDIENLVIQRLQKLAVTKETFQESFHNGARTLEIRTSPMPQGGIVTTFSDITDRISTATALERANESLERRVRERTAELLEVNKALEEAKAKADTANLDKTRFLAAASHDILQPLNAARLYTATLLERNLKNDDSALVGNVDASLMAVEEIFTALIDISRLDSGRLAPNIVDISLAKMFDQLRLEFGPMAQEKNLELRVVSSSVWVRSDRRMLRRILQNLVSNAIKYTRTGSVLLGVRHKGDNVLIQVIDAGPGIPADKKDVVFQEFQRLEGAGSQISGLGLGLSIVDRVCRMLQHDLSLDTEPGRGSTFSVRVPRGQVNLKPEQAQKPFALAGQMLNRGVLCIDNEPEVRNSMTALLSGWGLDVLVASSVVESVAVVQNAEQKPSIILADYHLDLGTGVNAIEAIRSQAGLNVPAIIITADHTAEVRQDIEEHGFGLLQKPVKAAALRALMLHNLNRSRPAAE
ncbi:MAG: PAS domain-containing hybrid sensor histidine kinase/response regulator [Hyphomicrobiaceae bacterium]